MSEPFNEPEFCKYTCDHGSFHKMHIKVSKMSLCRADVKVENRRRRILIWHENQRYPAGIYKRQNLHDLPIVLIKSINERRPGDIVYHYVGATANYFHFNKVFFA